MPTRGWQSGPSSLLQSSSQCHEFVLGGCRSQPSSRPPRRPPGPQRRRSVAVLHTLYALGERQAASSLVTLQAFRLHGTCACHASQSRLALAKILRCHHQVEEGMGESLCCALPLLGLEGEYTGQQLAHTLMAVRRPHQGFASASRQPTAAARRRPPREGRASLLPQPSSLLQPCITISERFASKVYHFYTWLTRDSFRVKAMTAQMPCPAHLRNLSLSPSLHASLLSLQPPFYAMCTATGTQFNHHVGCAASKAASCSRASSVLLWSVPKTESCRVRLSCAACSASGNLPASQR